MIIFKYSKQQHNQIIQASVKALKQGKIIVYPTDTCYGLAVDVSNIKAIKKLYRLKGRNFNKPSSVVVPSVSSAKKIVKWGSLAQKLAKKFWPGAITIVLELRIKNQELRILTAKTNFLGLRLPKNKIALDLAKALNKPITATSANLAGKSECYSVDEIVQQFQHQKIKPDMMIDAGKLPFQKPSTLVKLDDARGVSILRLGPITFNQINNAVSK
jgi:L-threonylcarbamoyladenylate synthase